jgi:peptide/nickel transport system substrate-binding protein
MLDRVNRRISAEFTTPSTMAGNVQAVVFTEVPYIRVGNFNSVTARSAKLDGYVAMPWPFFWNTGLQK